MHLTFSVSTRLLLLFSEDGNLDSVKLLSQYNSRDASNFAGFMTSFNVDFYCIFYQETVQFRLQIPVMFIKHFFKEKEW